MPRPITGNFLLQSCSRKSPGTDGVYPEVIKRGSRKLVDLEVLTNWKDTQLVTIFKEENRQDCSYYHGISLLSIPGKVFTYSTDYRPRQRIFLPEEQCSFCTNRGMMDMILQQIQEKCMKQNMLLYIFVNFTPAFDTINRET